MPESETVANPLRQYIDYLKRQGRMVVDNADFDDDWSPIGPKVRAQLKSAGYIVQYDKMFALSEGHWEALPGNKWKFKGVLV